MQESLRHVHIMLAKCHVPFYVYNSVQSVFGRHIHLSLQLLRNTFADGKMKTFSTLLVLLFLWKGATAKDLRVVCMVSDPLLDSEGKTVNLSIHT